jgi:hypothetical protein
MPKPKKPTKKDSGVSSPKSKTLFDHINEIRTGKNPKYFETLSESDKKTWSNYMVCRFLSMQPELVEYMNEIQRYSGILQPKEYYKVLIEIVPNGRIFYPYIKSKSEKYNSELLKLLSVHFQDSQRNILEYLSLLTKEDVVGIVSKYGYTEKQIKDMLEV